MNSSENKKLILALETSCDETGVCFLDSEGSYPDTKITIHANELASQVEDHQEYGGVFPSLAKRLHAENLPVLLEKILSTVDTKPITGIQPERKRVIKQWLRRHDGLAEKLFSIFREHGLPKLDGVAVTVGPGLEPALWVGINIARTIAFISKTPLIPVNHMEGHLVSGLVDEDITDGNQHTLQSINFPAVALLVSGGHTELIHISSWKSYKKIGQTRDDAAGEAFDKVGRLLGLPYPAGAHVSRLAEQARDVARNKEHVAEKFSLPRPMVGVNNLDFSFSGLKTAAARLIKKHQPLSDADCAEFAYELQAAIVDVLVQKTKKAIKKTKTKTLLVGGGVSANQLLRKQLSEIPNINTHISPLALAGDNAIMIGLAATAHYEDGIDPTSEVEADSRLSL